MTGDSLPLGKQFVQAACILGALWCLLPNAVAAFIALGATVEWWPNFAPPTFTPAWVLKSQLLAAVVVAVSGLIVSVLNLIHHATSLHANRSTAWRHLVSFASIPAAFILPASRLLLPLEDPYDGLGSPLASGMSIVISSFFSAILVLPVAIALAAATHTMLPRPDPHA